MSACTAPTYYEQIAFRVAVNRLVRDVVGDLGDFRGTQVRHFLVILWVDRDTAFQLVFLQSAYTVLQTCFAGECPTACQLLVAGVGHERAPSSVLSMIGGLMVG